MATILVVDDQPVNRQFLKTLLTYSGHRLVTASGGAEALAMARRDHPDLVITDVLMPGMDGYEFVRQLRNDPAVAQIHVIFYTAAYHQDDARALADACGVARVLTKPSEPETILEAVKSVLGDSNLPGSGAVPLEFDREHKRLLTDKLFEKVNELEAANAGLRGSELQYRELAARLQSVREEERTRVARQLHDELGQSLTALKMDCAWIRTRLSGAQTGVLARIQSSMELIDETIRTVRRLATELRPGVLDLGIQAAIEWQAHEFQARSGIECTVAFSAAEELLDSASATEIFRIFQETLTNVARHSGATQVKATLEQDRGELLLEIRDNGRGIRRDEIEKRNSLGLLGMRERASLIKAAFTIDGEPEHGTTVRVRIPLQTVIEAR